MARASKKLSMGSLLGDAAQYLGIDGIDSTGSTGPKKNKKRPVLTRKDKRKLDRKSKKENKSQHAKLRTAQPAGGAAGDASSSEEDEQPQEKSSRGTHSKRPAREGAPEAEAAPAPARKKAKHAAPAPAFEDPEDEEIYRLEKLLGLKQDDASRRKVAAKLNKEYEQFEGLGDDFGSFLLGLDDLASSKPYKRSKKTHGSDDGDDSGPEDGGMGVLPDLLDDDEYPEDDISYAEGEEGFSDEGGFSEDEGGDGEDDVSLTNSGGGEGESDGSEDEDGEEEEEEEEDDDAYYTATDGQDIYGKAKEGAAAGGSTAKYVPPALRNKAVSVIDEKSEKYVMLRRLMNGLLNRLSDDSKDSIVRSLKELFDTNSQLECCHCLNRCLMAACSNSTQVMVTLIPMYAAIVAALHVTVGISVGANLLELLVVTLHTEMHKTKNAAARQHELIGNKYANNVLLLIMFLYSLRVVHHSLVADILLDLTSLVSELCQSPATAPASEGVIELLVAVFETVGAQLNGDEPDAIRSAVAALSDATKNSVVKQNKRVQYMMDTVAELKSSKSKRAPAPMVETITRLRKWLGSVKTALGAKPGDLCLHITLQDFLQVETKGRWWRAGAAWSGRTTDPGADASELAAKKIARGGAEAYEQKSSTTSGGGEHAKLLVLASKMRMNTPVRRDIFVVMMGSMDPLDAFERLLRLDLRGKQDREVVKVLMECCGQEKAYNGFYAELACILCEENRQHKSTFQFAFWDAFKTLSEDNFSDRRAINLARCLGRLVAGFHISLSILKVLDMSELSNRMILFLATLFLSIFSSKVQYNVVCKLRTL
jgi:nucleolar MIF4G domain-containing protein 1